MLLVMMRLRVFPWRSRGEQDPLPPLSPQILTVALGGS